VGWFHAEDFPELLPGHLKDIERAREADGAAYFRR
jgi:hypothetical protein